MQTFLVAIKKNRYLLLADLTNRNQVNCVIGPIFIFKTVIGLITESHYGNRPDFRWSGRGRDRAEGLGLSTTTHSRNRGAEGPDTHRIESL